MSSDCCVQKESSVKIQSNIAKSILKLASSIKQDELRAVHAALGQVVTIVDFVSLLTSILQMLQPVGVKDTQEQTISLASQAAVKKDVKNIASNMMKLESHYNHMYQPCQ